MVAGIPKPERRLTKVRRKLSTAKRSSSSGRSEKDGKSRPTSPQHLPRPLLTTWDDLRSSSTTRLQLREHFSSTFPESDISPLSDSTTQGFTAPRRPSTSSLAESHRSNVEDQQSIDVPAAIALLQELKKNASPEELVALHKALLPVRRSVDASSISSPPDLESSTAPDSRYTSHRRSHRYPGLATRGNDPLQTIEEMEIKRRSYREEKRRMSAAIEAGQNKHTPATSIAVPKSGNLARSTSSGSSVNTNVGWYRAGTLRITNRDPSPSSVQLETPNELSVNLKSVDGTDELSDPNYVPVQLAAFDNESGLPHRVLEEHNHLSAQAKSVDHAQDLPGQHKILGSPKSLRGLAEAKIDSGINLTMLPSEGAIPTRYALSETDLSGPPMLLPAFSSSKVSLNAAMEEYSQFSASPYDRISMPQAPEEHRTTSSSSCDSFKTSVEARPEHERGRQARERANERPPLPALMLDKLPKFQASERTMPMPPQHGDSGYASEESNGRPSQSLDYQRLEHGSVPDLRPITPKSPHSSIRTLRSRNTEEAYLPSSIDALPPAAHAFQRIEDIFVAPGETRPSSKRQTLLSSLGLGRKSSESSKSVTDLSRAKSTSSTAPRRTLSAGGKEDKGPKKLQKTSSRKTKQARKELAKFDPEPELQAQTMRALYPAVNVVTNDVPSDWYGQEQYYQPQVPNRHVPSVNRDRWQAYHYDTRRYRNLSVVQEVDHDSLMDHDERLVRNSVLSSRRSEVQYSECGEIPIGMSLLQPVHSNRSARSTSYERPERTSMQSKHRVSQSVSSISSVASGQLDLIEEVQNATIDWAVQAKFWRARRTLVGQAFQQEQDQRVDQDTSGDDQYSHDEQYQYDQHHDSEEYGAHSGRDEDDGQSEHDAHDQHGEHGDYGERDKLEGDQQHEEHEQHYEESIEKQAAEDDQAETTQESDIQLTPTLYSRDFSAKFRNMESASLMDSSIASRPRNTLVEAAFGLSEQTMNERLPISELLGRRHMALPGRFSGGLQYEWNREAGLVGSAGFNDNVSSNNGRSLPSRLRYGVDLSDVPVFVSKAGPDRMRSSVSIANAN